MKKKFITSIIILAISLLSSVYAGENILRILDVSGSAGEQIEVFIEIENEDAFTAFQFDLLWPAGFSFSGGLAFTGREVTGSTSSPPFGDGAHILDAALLTNGIRIIAYSLDNKLFTGNNGPVVKFQLNTPVNSGLYDLVFAGTLEIVSPTLGNVLSGSENGQAALCGDFDFSASTVTNVSCFGRNDGAIDITVAGGDGTLGYLWSGPDDFTSTDKDLDGLSAGEYVLTVTDALGCQASETFNVIEPEDLPAPTANDVEVCFDGESHSASASTTEPGATIKYYTTEDGDIEIGAPTGTNPGEYTAWATTYKDGCVSSVRTLVTLAIIGLPDAPQANNVTVVYDNTEHTASATPPDGSSLLWYDAEVDGNLTTAPTGTSVGTYTAWAASVSSTAFCESGTRTLVTLTITPLFGDANCDGVITVADIVAMVSFIKNDNPIPFCFPNADVNSDNNISASDIVLVVEIIKNL